MLQHSCGRRIIAIMVAAVGVMIGSTISGPVTLTQHVYGQQPAASDIFSYYQTALAIAQSTNERDLSIVCQKQLPDKIFTKEGNMFVSFLAGSTKKIMLVVFSKTSLTDPQSSIHFGGKFQRGVEWMFVFDRDRDGRVDYILWPVGVSPYVEGTPPPGFPMRTGHATAMSREQFALIRQFARMIFQHWADENFEGKRSAVILEAWDPGGLFAVTGWQVIRSSRYDGVLDQCWYFTRNIADKIGECERVDQGYKTRTFDAQDITPADMVGGSGWFSMINEAAGLCPLTGDSF